MKNCMIALFSVSSLMISLQAQENPQSKTIGSHRFSFMPHYSYDKYEGVGKNVDAHFVGMNLGYEYLKSENIYFGVNSHSHVAVSNKEETSYYDYCNSPSIHGHFSLRGGYTFSPYEKTLLSPYITVGSHIWRTDKHNELAVHYYGIGFSSRVYNIDKWEISLNPEVFKSKQEHGKRAYGIKLELPIVYNMDSGFEIGVVPTFKRFHRSLGYMLGAGVHLAKRF